MTDPRPGGESGPRPSLWSEWIANAERALAVAEKLKISTITLLLLAAFSVGLAWYGLEHRETLFGRLLESAQIGYYSGGAATFAIVFLMGAWLVSRSDRQKDADRKREKEQRDEALQRERDQKEEITRLMNARLELVTTQLGEAKADREALRKEINARDDARVLERNALMMQIDKYRELHEECEADRRELRLVAKMNHWELPPNSRLSDLDEA